MSFATIKAMVGHPCKIMLDESAGQEWRMAAVEGVDIKKTMVLSSNGEPTGLDKTQASLSAAFNFSSTAPGVYTLVLTLVDVTTPDAEKEMETVTLILDSCESLEPGSN
jgi:hypothetical protein